MTRTDSVTKSSAPGEPTVNSGSSKSTSAPAPEGPVGSSGQHVQAGESVATKRDHGVRGVRVDARVSARRARCGSTGTQSSGVDGASGASASAKSSASRLWVINSRSPAGSTSYSRPWRRGLTTHGSSSGWPAASSRLLAGQPAAAGDDHPVVVPAAVDAHPEPLVALGEHASRRPPGRRRAGAGAPRTAATPRRAGCRTGGSRRPTRRRTRCRGSRRASGSPVGEVLDPEREPLVAGDVDRVGQQPAARARRLKAPRAKNSCPAASALASSRTCSPRMPLLRVGRRRRVRDGARQ